MLKIAEPQDKKILSPGITPLWDMAWQIAITSEVTETDVILTKKEKSRIEGS